MSFVFLSHAREDAQTAEHLVRLLRKDGHDVFWDREIRFGEDHRKVIVDRLESAACVLVLWSRHSADSHWVNQEARSALDRQSIVEARLDDSRPPPPSPAADRQRALAGPGALEDPRPDRACPPVEVHQAVRQRRPHLGLLEVAGAA